MVPAWNSSRRPGEQRQSTVGAGRQESLGDHWSGRRRVAPGPRTFCFRTRAGQGSRTAAHPSGLAGLWARQGRGQPAGQDLAGALGAGWGPRPCPRPPPRMDRWRSLRRAGAPGLLAPRPRPAPRRRAVCCKALTAAKANGERNLPRPAPPPGRGRRGKEGVTTATSQWEACKGRGGVAQPRFRVGCTVCAPRRSLEGSAAASWHCGVGCGVGAGTAGHPRPG